MRFLGFEPNVQRWMQAADGFVLSSRYEGLPMVLLEAGACGLPAVATDVPGTREVIVNGETGWLAPAGDADALAQAMAKLMRTPPEERRAMGERARRRCASASAWKPCWTGGSSFTRNCSSRKSARRRIRLTARRGFETPERRFSLKALRQGQGGRLKPEEYLIDGGELSSRGRPESRTIVQCLRRTRCWCACRWSRGPSACLPGPKAAAESR